MAKKYVGICHPLPPYSLYVQEVLTIFTSEIYYENWTRLLGHTVCPGSLSSMLGRIWIQFVFRRTDLVFFAGRIRFFHKGRIRFFTKVGSGFFTNLGSGFYIMVGSGFFTKVGSGFFIKVGYLSRCITDLR